MKHRTKQNFYMYTSDRFLEFAKKYAGELANQTALADIRETRKRYATPIKRTGGRPYTPALLRRRIARKIPLLDGYQKQIEDTQAEIERLRSSPPTEEAIKLLQGYRAYLRYLEIVVEKETHNLDVLVRRLRSIEEESPSLRWDITIDDLRKWDVEEEETEEDEEPIDAAVGPTAGHSSQ